MARENTNPDNDRLYRRPKAWLKMKLALGRRDKLCDALQRLEQIPGCPRVTLDAVVRHFLSLPPDQQRRAIYAGLSGEAAPPAATPPKPPTPPAPPPPADPLYATDPWETDPAEWWKPRPGAEPAQDESPKPETARAAWKRLAPPGWPFPPNLPADVTVTPPLRPGLPPFVGTLRRHYCPQCGRGFVMVGHYAAHLERQHGWTREEGTAILLPPAFIVPAREELAPAERAKWARMFDEAFGEGRAAA